MGLRTSTSDEYYTVITRLESMRHSPPSCSPTAPRHPTTLRLPRARIQLDCYFLASHLAQERISPSRQLRIAVLGRATKPTLVIPACTPTGHMCISLTWSHAALCQRQQSSRPATVVAFLCDDDAPSEPIVIEVNSIARLHWIMTTQP